MSKQSTITNLIVMPLIASAVFLASPAFASSHMKTTHKEVRNVTTNGNVPNTKKGVVGTVSSMNGNILIVTSKNNTNYTVDASKATIMKEGLEPTTNPSLVSITDIKVGDFIMVRGVINNTEITASRIFDGRPHAKGMRHKEFEKMHHRKK